MRGMINPELRLGFIVIEKNGSTTMSQYLPRHGFHDFRVQDGEWPEDYEYFMVVRGPIGRWLAACNTMAHVNSVPYQEYLSNAQRYHHKEGRLWTHDNNGHFRKQTSYIPEGLSIRFFWLHEIRTKVPAWLDYHGILLTGEFPHKMETRQEEKQYGFRAISQIDRGLIRAHYAEDILFLGKLLGEPRQT